MLNCTLGAFGSEFGDGGRNQMENLRPHILIVEDSEDDQLMYAYHLIREGYRVTGANDGLDGLGKAFNLSPDLILLDLRIPKLTGWEVMHRLRADERTKNIPILVVTGLAVVHPQESDGFLIKPCSLDQLSAEIARRVGSPASKSSPTQAA
jgi:two-component system, cell cycle response regulator DivK